jgi:hypothetical protein
MLLPEFWLHTHLRAERSDKRRLHRRYFITSKNDWSTAHRLFWSHLKQKHSSSSINGSIPNSICRVAFIQQRLLPGGFWNLQVTISWRRMILLPVHWQFAEKQPNKPSIKIVDYLGTNLHCLELHRSIYTKTHKNFFHFNSLGTVTSMVNSTKYTVYGAHIYTIICVYIETAFHTDFHNFAVCFQL